MPVPVQTPTQSATANGIAVTFPYAFTVLDQDDLKVTGTIAGAIVAYTLGVDYSVVGVGTDAGAAVFVTPPANGTIITTYRDSQLERETDYQNGGDLLAETLDMDFDRLWLVLQEFLAGSKISPRALRVPAGETVAELPPAAARALRLIGFDAAGDLTLNAPVAGSASALALLLASYANATQGAGMIGYDPALPYGANTIGQAVKNSGIRNPEQFGCVGDGVTDDSANMQVAMNAAAGGILVLTAGKNYRLHSSVTVPAGTWVIGYGATVSLATTVAIAGAGFTVTGANVVFEGITFDLGFTRLATYASYPNLKNGGIYGVGSTNLKVLNCNFTQLYTQSVTAYTADGVTVRGCKFSSPAQTQNLRLEHIHFQTMGTAPILVEGNDFKNDAPASIGAGVCAIFASGTTGPLTIEKNRFDFCGRDNTGAHRLGVIDFYGNGVSIRVVGNRATNCMAQFMRVADVFGGEISGNEISMAAVAEINGVTLSIESTTAFLGVGVEGIQNINVHHNRFKGNTDATRFGVTVNAYDFGTPCRNVRVCDNNFEDIGTIVQVNGPFNDVRIERNGATGTYGSVISQQYTGGGITLTAINGVTQAQSFYGNLYIKGNVLLDLASPSLNRVGITLDMTKTAPPYTGTLGEFDVCDNTVYSQSANSAQAISFNGIASANTARVYVRDNELTNYNYALYLRNALAITVGQNTYVSIATAPLLESGNTSVTEEISPAGTYTPTSTGVANIGASLTPGVCQYQSNGKMVFVSGSFTIVQATAGLFTQFRLSLPFPAALGAALSGKLGGAGSSLTTNQSWSIANNGTNDDAYFQSLADTSLSHTATFSFMYQRT